MDSRPMKGDIVLLTNIPRPYRIPLFEELSRRFEARGRAFRVLFFSRPESHRRRAGVRLDLSGVGFRHDFCEAAWEIPLGPEKVLSIPRGFLSRLESGPIDAMILGGFSIHSWLARHYCLRRRIPYILWSGAVAERDAAGRVRTELRKSLVRGAAGFVAYGTAARRYLESLGADGKKVRIGINTVDTDFFLRQSESCRARRDPLKKEMGWADRNVVYVGRLADGKGVDLLQQAFASLKGPFQLHLVGDGPREAAFRAAADSRTRFWGLQQTEALPGFYALADLLVFPSLIDVWGLVVNEALACGTPVVSSSLAGATEDLVEDGRDGFAVDPRNVKNVGERIQAVLLDSALGDSLGRRGLEIIAERATIPHSAEGFLQAVEEALR
jgi:glycosyltransferase involved in cell wall biosynthesis